MKGKSKGKIIKWWLFAIVVFLIFIALQIPANWLVAKFYKNNHIFSNVSGNLWQGQADWRYADLSGVLRWKTQPLDLILLRAAANIEVSSANTLLTSKVSYGLNKRIKINQLNGQITPDTLKQLLPWQWPASHIQLNNLSLSYSKDQGFSDAEGQLQWAGGDLMYQMGDRQDRINLPSLQGQLQSNDGRIQLDLRDRQAQKMANIIIDPNLMMDVQLTQRLLLNAPSYHGKAGLDTYVISTRQPLISGGF